MGRCRVIRVSDASFVGQDGRQVTGIYVYVVAQDSAAPPRRFFFTAQRRASLVHDPQVGDEVYLIQNDMGRVVDILLA